MKYCVIDVGYKTAAIAKLLLDDRCKTCILVTLVNEAKKYLTEENGKEPTIKELPEYTRFSEEKLEDILVMTGKQ